MKPKPIKREHQALLIKIGEKLKDLRKEKGISYIQMAEEVGISRNTYNQIENGNVYFNFLTLLSVLDYYKISLLDFFIDLDVKQKWKSSSNI